MARWTVNGLVRTGARSAPGRFVLRVLRDLGSLALVDRGMTLAAHVFTSILPILIVAGAVRASLDPQSGPLIAEHLGLDEATAQILEDSLPGGAQELRVTGIVGVVLLVIAATSFARALERSLRTIWRTPTVSIKFAWRWLAALMTVIIGLALIVATRTVLVATVRSWRSSSFWRSCCGARCGGSRRGSSSIDASACASCCPDPCSPGSASPSPAWSGVSSFRPCSPTRPIATACSAWRSPTSGGSWCWRASCSSQRRAVGWSTSRTPGERGADRFRRPPPMHLANDGR